MQNKTRQFLIKISGIPSEVGFYYQSSILSDSLNKINSDYDLKSNFLSEYIDDITINDFNFSNLESILKINLSIDDKTAKQLAIDYLGMIFLPIDKYVNNVDIKKEIIKRGGNVNNYKNYVDKLVDIIEDENFKLIDELIKKHEESVDQEEEKNAATQIMQNNLVDVLKSGANNSLNYLNGGLIYLFFNVKGFKENAEKIIFSNEEKLTRKIFILDGKPHTPSVRNWLKDFIKQHGTSVFDNIALSRYVINSPNAKRLDENEKNLLRKLLILYRNLKFFPESLAEVPVEQWEIIPSYKFEETMIKARTVGGPPATAAEEKIEGLKQEEKRYAKGGLEEKAIEEEIEKEKRIEELRYMAGQYPAGSLEKKAIEEEMRKLSSGRDTTQE